MPKGAGRLSCLTAIAGHVFVGLGVLVAVFIEDAEVVGVFLKGVELAVLRGMRFGWLEYSFFMVHGVHF